MLISKFVKNLVDFVSSGIVFLEDLEYVVVVQDIKHVFVIC